MSAHHDEQQDIENAKYFWRNGGKWLFAALVAGALGYLGHVIYQNHQQNRNEEASLMALKAQQSGDAAQLATLQQQFDGSAAAAQATLNAAQQAFDKGNYEEAAKAYRWVLEHQKNDVFQAVAAQNLANVLVQQKQYEQALSVLATPVAAAFVPLADEGRGDVYAAQGKQAEAKTAYQAALDKLPQDAPNREALQLKLAQL
ncbi:tetratricopeptide repeat protein [Conchiformibius steedae DSM 2580]|uniref:Ancillary SecYEG translocon subunit n=1 Tax=Conchiformibius steedae DSM 2580 TaxID=1121352 RepID=A0AAE9HW89_9NEIS|nr:tetratricopeptide repeat protein [Conchiformibius steedae]QMT33034.1 tetratricopeptide repeat protein [Conchiformibius steedae]URD67661.1 tetratricopeptide repeat protein [Conchiformibius steedae DSM 2580]